MALIEVNKDPSPRDLRWFGLMLFAFMSVVGAILRWRFGHLEAAIGVWIAGAALAAFYYALPPVRRPMLVGWMYLTLPIGWVVSHVVLALLYYIVLTPIGLFMRLCLGRDPMQRRIEPARATYWTARPVASDAQRYFRQF